MENYPYNTSYPESGNSTPRSREIEFENPPPWEDNQSSQSTHNFKVKLMCSYGGEILPRPHDNQLSYVGGETKILSVDRCLNFGTLLSKLTALCSSTNAISFKYQLPGEDLDALISVTNDEDLEHMMHEYDRLHRISPKPARLRVFIFPSQSPSLNSSARSFGSDDARSEKERFVEALNSAPSMTTAQQPAVPAAAAQLQPPTADFLFGFEKAPVQNLPISRVPEFKEPVVAGLDKRLIGSDPIVAGLGEKSIVPDPIVSGLDERLIGSDPIQKHIVDLQRLRIEEQQGSFRRKSDENLSGGSDYYRPTEKIPQAATIGGIPHWTEKNVTGGVFPVNTAINSDQAVYMIPSPTNAYHAPFMRPTQGYYAVQRLPPDMYGVIPQGGVAAAAAGQPTLPLHNVAGYSEAFGMVRPATTGGIGMVMEEGRAQVGYDGGMGRQVVYSAPPGGLMGAPASFQVSQYQAMAAGMSTDIRSGGAGNAEAGGKFVANSTQASL